MKILNTLLFFACLAVAVTAKASFPLVKNFPCALHEGGTQTWAIAEDKSGRMIFGNKNGLLSYDANSWQLHGVANGSTVRSLLLDDSGDEKRLYVGASEQIGYFRYNKKSGVPEFVDLTPRLPQSSTSFGEVWNIMSIPDEGDIYFQADNELIVFDGTDIYEIQAHDKITATAMIGGRIYVATAHHGMSVLEDRTLRAIAGNERLRRTKICAILPFDDDIMIVTDYDGLYLYNGSALSPLSSSIDGFLARNQVFCASCHKGLYAFGTVSRGVVIKNFATGKTIYANKDTGMQNNTVLTTYFDSCGNLWLGLDDGIDLLYINAPYYSLLGNASAYGAGYMSLHDGELLYLGTNQGLYSMPYSEEASDNPPVLRPILKGQVWDIAKIGDDIFACTDAGLYHGRGERFMRVSGVPGSWAILPLPHEPDAALVSTYDAFHIVRRTPAGWTDSGAVSGYGDRGGHFSIDNEGLVWISHWLKGLYCLTLDSGALRFTQSKFYNSAHGLPTDHNIGVTILRGRPLVLTEGGFFRPTADAQAMQPDTTLNNIFGPLVAPRLHSAPDDAMWCVYNNRISVAAKGRGGHTAIDSITYSGIGPKLIPGFDNFNFISPTRLLVSVQDGFFDVDLRQRHDDAAPKPVYFKTMRAYGDSTVIYLPGNIPDQPIVLSYAINSISIEVAAPEFRADNALTYSYYLENYDSSWSEFSPSAVKEYTQLPEGDYVIHARAYNAFTHSTQEQHMRFTILPPWYRSTPARIIYFILAAALLIAGMSGIRHLSLRASRKVAERKQSELDEMRRAAREESLLKDYEIADLKGRQLEADIQHKTRELSNITMNVVRKNEILNDISKRLDGLSAIRDATELRHHISVIQSMIKDNISHDDDWKTFFHNFDAAYGDFTQRLRERHPSLTPTELRVCCYLIMGLNSKDMAGVFNISYRSVEMTRYRLRKKLELERETNLTEYLFSIFNSSKTGSR